MIQATVPYFTFDGEATEALDFYKKCFKRKLRKCIIFTKRKDSLEIKTRRTNPPCKTGER